MRSTPSSAYRHAKSPNRRWVPSLFFWGGSAGVLVTLALSGVPLFKKDVLLNTPVVCHGARRLCSCADTCPCTVFYMCLCDIQAFFYEGTCLPLTFPDKTPDSDKPF